MLTCFPSEGVAFPPHRRGWTRCLPACGIDFAVSPAQAGMDPQQASEEETTEGFPRTGGDGPRFNGLGQRLLPFPPHRRGWTYLWV